MQRYMLFAPTLVR